SVSYAWDGPSRRVRGYRAGEKPSGSKPEVISRLPPGAADRQAQPCHQGLFIQTGVKVWLFLVKCIHDSAYGGIVQARARVLDVGIFAHFWRPLPRVRRVWLSTRGKLHFRRGVLRG